MPRLERRLPGFEQPLRLVRDLADRERERRVADEAVERDADVDGEHVALLSVYGRGCRGRPSSSATCRSRPGSRGIP
jgi:hypothetical protein